MTLRIGQWLFKNRGWLGIPFFLAALVFARVSWTLLFSGLALCALGEMIRWVSVSFSGPTTRSRQVEAEALATQGPYAWVRNPIYWGNFMVGGGMLLSSGAWFPWLPGIFVMLFWAEYLLIILAEEHYLSERFGRAYGDYCRRVRRILPVPRRTSWRRGAWRAALRSEKSTLLVILGYYLALALRLALL